MFSGSIKDITRLAKIQTMVICISFPQNGGKKLVNKGGGTHPVGGISSRSLKSVWALLAQILGPFGPPKKHLNFDLFKK